ncbi:hypothetical protein TRVA0_095S00144 [Trichomonascus vanleenenianus]|uniref:NADP-dependent oxidoreductase n=1 Tax=Trichomonascus vanleenenianus TaxID=2268995 RepID=UPI003ECAF694
MAAQENMRVLLQPDTDTTRLILLHCAVPVVEPDSSDHLIRVHCVAPCSGELLWPKNHPPPGREGLVSIPCYDVAGTVVSAPKASRFKVGDEVYARTNYFRATGCACDYIATPASEFARRPKKLSWVESTAIPLSSQTAWEALFIQSGIGDFTSPAWKGKRVLVTAVSGGVGAWVAQFASLAGAEVIGTCGPANVAYAKSMGAKEVINYRSQSLKDWAAGDDKKKVDLVIDCIGRKSLEDAWWVVRDNGMVISIYEPPEQARPADLEFKSSIKHLFFIMDPNGEQLEKITELVDQGKCRPTVDSVWPLEQFEHAFERLDSEHARGKIVFDMLLNGGNTGA